MIAKGFWGGFVKSFERSSSSRKKRSSDNVDVKIDAVIMMAEQINETFLNTALKDAIEDAKIGVVGDIKCRKYGNNFQKLTFTN